MNKTNCVFSDVTKNSFIYNFLEHMKISRGSNGGILYAGIVLVDQLCGVDIPLHKDNCKTPQIYYDENCKRILNNIIDAFMDDYKFKGVPLISKIMIDNLKSEYKNSNVIINKKNETNFLYIDEKKFEFLESESASIFNGLFEAVLKEGLTTETIFESFNLHFEIISKINDKWKKYNHYMLFHPVTYSFIKTQTLLYLTLIGETDEIDTIVKNKNESVKNYISKIYLLTYELLKDQIKYISLIFLNHSIKSAIAAIMSRNGSHNIGSHVLAAVGTNSIDLPDDQILFKYIQHRMDYVAQITTEIPGWTYSSLFVQDIMRRFYMQRHLLNNIARSEGLEAYEYQGRPKDDKGKPSQNEWTGQLKDKLIIKVKKHGSDDYLISPCDNIEKLDVLSLAIPGGVIGQHAFFAILENIIRNSAKHEWSGYGSKSSQNNLEITIEYEDNLEKDFVVFRIWDNVSDVFRNSNMQNADKATLANESPKKLMKKCKDKDSDSDEFQELPLHQKLNCYLSKSFVKQDTGELSKENWGLAEMKISAGYLNKRSIEEIGEDGSGVLFELNNKGSYYTGLIRAIAIKDELNGETPYRLGFEFAVPKPKELLIIGDQIPKETIQTGAKKNSVYYSETDPDSLDYEFVLFQEDQCNKLNAGFEYWHYPHRLFCVCDDDKQCNLKNKIVPINESELMLFREKGRWNGDWDKLKLFLYRKWLRVRYSDNLNDPVSLYVNTNANSSSGGDSGKSAFGILLNYYNDEIYDRICDEKVIDKETFKTFVNTSIHSEKPILNLREFCEELAIRFSINFETENDIYNKYKRVLNTIENLMIKYDENIETLPDCYWAKRDERSNPWEKEGNEDLFDNDPNFKIVLEVEDPRVKYKRHRNPKENDNLLPEFCT